MCTLTKNEPMPSLSRTTLAILVAAVLTSSCASTGGSPSAGATERKPAEVMSWLGAAWLERESRQREERPDLLLDFMGLSPGGIVADVGAGTGYYARRMARRVAPEGRVYAVDIQPEMLAIMTELAARESVDGIVPVLGEPDDPKLPQGALDWILLVDVYHEFQRPDSMLAELGKALLPEGRIALVEYRLEGDTAQHIRRDHRMSKEQVMEEWTSAGFALVDQYEELPSQHVFVFQRAVRPVSPTDTMPACELPTCQPSASPTSVLD